MTPVGARGSVSDAGFQVGGARDLIDMKIHGVEPKFLEDLTAAGYDIPAKEVIDLRIHGVSSEYIRDLKDYGLRPAARDLVQFKIHGVGADFLRDTKALGYDFTPQEIVNLKIHGVDGRYLRRLRDSGMRNLTAEQIHQSGQKIDSPHLPFEPCSFFDARACHDPWNAQSGVVDEYTVRVLSVLGQAFPMV